MSAPHDDSDFYAPAQRQTSGNSLGSSASASGYDHSRVPYSSSTEKDPYKIGVTLRRATLQQSTGTIIQGDHLQLASNQEIQKILQKQGEQTILFGDIIAKVNRHNRIVKRLLLITEKAMYFFETDTLCLKRRIPLEEIYSLCLSEFSDNFFAIIVPKEYDYLLISTRKSEIVTALNMAVQRSHGGELNVSFSNKFELNFVRGTTREVVFSETNEGMISTKIVIDF